MHTFYAWLVQNSERGYSFGMKNFKVIVTVPEKDADRLRQAIGEAGGDVIGNYSFCSFSVKGIGRFKPNENANPAIGAAGNFEAVEEERIEFPCAEDKLPLVVEAIKKAHPYEEPVIDVLELFEI